MQEKQTQHFVGLDVGTSMVRVVVGMFDQEANSVSIVGHGTSTNAGMRRGVVVHIDDVAEAIRQAVNDAERVSGINIRRATVNINGSHIMGIDSKGVIAISNADREISQDDRYRVEEAATIIHMPPNREIVQVFAKNYRVDGTENIKDPVGMHGVRLEVDAHMVTASMPALKSLDSALDAAGINPSHHVVSSLGAAEAVLNRQQKESGTLVLDIGAGTTNLVVLEDGEVQHVAVIPMGGTHITNDLAIGLKTDLDIAEQVKIKHAVLGKQSRSPIKIAHKNGLHTFSADDVAMITEARVEEIMEYVEKELKKIHRSRKLPGGIVIVGGTSKLPGLAAFTREQLQLAARIGSLQPISGLIETVADSTFTPAVGLMMLDMLLGSQASDHAATSKSGGVFNFLSDFWGKIKP